MVRWVEISWFRPFFLILGDTMGYNYQENVCFFFPGVSENRVYPKNGMIYRRTSSWFDGFVWFHLSQVLFLCYLPQIRGLRNRDPFFLTRNDGQV